MWSEEEEPGRTDSPDTLAHCQTSQDDQDTGLHMLEDPSLITAVVSQLRIHYIKTVSEDRYRLRTYFD